MCIQQENPSFYAVIPANVRYDKRISAAAKLLYGEISALANKQGYCYASNSYFAKLYEISERQIRRLVNDLKECGYITLCTDDNLRKIYLGAQESKPTEKSANENAPSDGQKCPQGGTKMSEKADKNVLQNNINNNINNIYSAPNYSSEFEEWYCRYPNKFNKRQTFENWRKALKTVSVADLNRALDNYLADIAARRTDSAYITRSTNFLGRKCEFVAWLEIDSLGTSCAAAAPVSSAARRSIDAADEIIRQRKEALGL